MVSGTPEHICESPLVVIGIGTCVERGQPSGQWEWGLVSIVLRFTHRQHRLLGCCMEQTDNGCAVVMQILSEFLLISLLLSTVSECK